MIQELNGKRKTEGVISASGLFVDERFPIKPDYQRAMKEFLGTEVKSVNLKHEPEESRASINRWVKEHTQERIEQLLPARAINAWARIIIVDAVRLKANWMFPFNPERTKEGAFHLADGSTRRVPMMSQTGWFNYLENEDFRLLSLPYEGSETSLLLLLPNKHNGLKKLEDNLDADRLDALMRSARSTFSYVVLPRFKFDPAPSGSLALPLMKMGMKSAFRSETADFSGISESSERLSIGDVFQKTYVRVDEQGTEATAATAVTMLGIGGGDGRRVLKFIVDRPFVFLIRNERTGLILFSGRVVNPLEGETSSR